MPSEFYDSSLAYCQCDDFYRTLPLPNASSGVEYSAPVSVGSGTYDPNSFMFTYGGAGAGASNSNSNVPSFDECNPLMHQQQTSYKENGPLAPRGTFPIFIL
jgi:hypothetical protein